uniref:Capsid protein n=1 Tax=Tobacco rattle virus TaxID=12295 RepID=Q6YA86_9VIRU|nr:capsid protein [Tobacco rattle virus]ABE27890.1 capsid protein [Tobacco rattle virus]WDD63239.1 coat protein [Tobacco rattle virus]
MTDGMYDEEFDSKALNETFSPWVEEKNWKDVLMRLSAMKFALQADRDKIPGVLSDLKKDCPFSAFKRFPDKEMWSKLTKEAVIALAQIQAASSFKRRADEKNAVSGLITATPAQASTSNANPSGSATTVVRPPRLDDSSFQEDSFSFGKFDDASTAYHKALSYLEGLNLKPLYRRQFEKSYNTRWVPAAAPVAPGPRPNP